MSQIHKNIYDVNDDMSFTNIQNNYYLNRLLFACIEIARGI